jgi:Flp pilus assembly protein TadB
MQSAREAHDRRLEEKDELLRQHQAKAVKTSRRIRLAFAAVGLCAVFIIVGLAGLFSQVWEYFAAVVVVLSFFGVLDQFSNRGS